MLALLNIESKTWMIIECNSFQKIGSIWIWNIDKCWHYRILPYIFQGRISYSIYDRWTLGYDWIFYVMSIRILLTFVWYIMIFYTSNLLFTITYLSNDLLWKYKLSIHSTSSYLDYSCLLNYDEILLMWLHVGIQNSDYPMNEPCTWKGLLYFCRTYFLIVYLSSQLTHLWMWLRSYPPLEVKSLEN